MTMSLSWDLSCWCGKEGFFNPLHWSGGRIGTSRETSCCSWILNPLCQGESMGNSKNLHFSWVLSAVNAAGKENHYSRHCGCSSDQKKKKNSLCPHVFWFFGRYRLQITKQTSKILMVIAVVWIFVSLSNSQVQILMSNVMVSVGGHFGRWLGFEASALISKINTLIKESWLGSFASSTMCG